MKNAFIDFTIILSQILTDHIRMSGWDITERILAIFGLLSIILSAIRFLFALKQLTWIANVSIQDHPLQYCEEDFEKNPISLNLWDNDHSQEIFGNTVVFKPIDCIIPRLDVIELDEHGEKKCIINTYKNVTPNQPICIRLMRAECIPQYMLKWYSDYGEYGIHYFNINGRTGINDVKGSPYHKTAASIIRRILGLK